MRVRPEDREGAWTGTGTNAAIFGNDAKLLENGTMTLLGESVYAGFTAHVLRADEDGWLVPAGTEGARARLVILRDVAPCRRAR